jgi:hypothetical protein
METSKKAPKVKFRTTILASGKTITGIQIPEKLVEALGRGKRVPVRVTMNGYTYRNTIAVMSGKFCVGVSAEVREAAGVKAGDHLEVTLEVDTQPREVELPAEFKKALNKNPKAKSAFEKLSYSNKRVHVIPIANAKTDETRMRNVAKAIDALSR